MVGLPDEDGPTMSSDELKAVVRAETEASPPEEEDAEDGPTVQATVSPEVSAATPRPGPPRPGPPRPDSKPKLAPPAPAPAPPAAAPGREEEEQDSITATAPRVDASKLRVSVPVIPLTPIEGEEDLETEVKTMTGADGPALVAALAAAAPVKPVAPVPPPPEDDDPATMTAQAPAPTGAVPETTASPLGDDDDEDGATVNTAAPMTTTPTSSQAIRVRISSKSLMEPSTLTGTGDVPTKPGVDKHEAPTKSGVGAAPSTPQEYEPEDSITSRALAKAEDVAAYEEDSTTQALAPAVGAAAGLIPPTGRSDDTDATTQKKSKPPASPADEEQESITTQAPGHLTNMLRVIASDAARGSSPEVPPAFEDDEPPENKTAVMPNAPVKGAPGGGPFMKHGTLQGMGPVSPPSTRPPAISPLGGHLSVAPRLDPSSESGLRVAHGDAASGEHASLGVILGAKERMSSNRVGVDSEARLAHASTELVFPPLAQPEDFPPPRTPRYGLLVTVVAAISVIVPVSLYVFLNRGEDAVTPGVPAQPSADVVKRDDPVRQKFVKPPKGGKHH